MRIYSAITKMRANNGQYLRAIPLGFGSLLHQHACMYTNRFFVFNMYTVSAVCVHVFVYMHTLSHSNSLYSIYSSTNGHSLLAERTGLSFPGTGNMGRGY